MIYVLLPTYLSKGMMPRLNIAARLVRRRGKEKKDRVSHEFRCTKSSKAFFKKPLAHQNLEKRYEMCGECMYNLHINLTSCMFSASSYMSLAPSLCSRHFVPASLFSCIRPSCIFPPCFSLQLASLFF